MRVQAKTKKYFKCTVLLIVMLLFILSNRNILGLAGETARNDSGVYETDSYCVTFSVEDNWQDAKRMFISIENKGISTISNWFLAFKMQGKITEIWNAKVCAQVSDLYVIKNVEYNQDILPGDIISFGFILEESENFLIPQSFLIPMKTIEVDSSAYTVEVIENFEWLEGYSGDIIITNKSNQTIDDWELEIAFGTDITSIWNGSIISEEGDTYKIGNGEYNQNIQPGESISIGFLGRKLNDTITVTEYNLTEVTVAEVVDNIVDKTIFEDIIPITEDYFISPLYSVNEDISAYLVQYYSEEGKGCSYIVVNNVVDSRDQYYIEFGYGNAPVITALCNAYLENINDGAYKVLYLGGYDYYIEGASGIYKMEEGKLYRLSEEELQYFLDTVGDVQYYEKGKTLTYDDILAKEIGYSSYEANIDNTSPTIYISMDDAEDECRDRGYEITGHCAPTAATNMLIYLSRIYPELSVDKNNFADVFIQFYRAMGTNEKGTLTSKILPAYVEVLKWLEYDSVRTDIFPFVTWSRAKQCIQKGAVHLALIDSQIYGNHAVLGVGYVSFSHSSGWISNYFQIVDGGGGTKYRYVNYSLGISRIDLFEIKLGTLENPYPTPVPPSN